MHGPRLEGHGGSPSISPRARVPTAEAELREGALGPPSRHPGGCRCCCCVFTRQTTATGGCEEPGGRAAPGAPAAPPSEPPVRRLAAAVGSRRRGTAGTAAARARAAAVCGGKQHRSSSAPAHTSAAGRPPRGRVHTALYCSQYALKVSGATGGSRRRAAAGGASRWAQPLRRAAHVRDADLPPVRRGGRAHRLGRGGGGALSGAPRPLQGVLTLTRHAAGPHPTRMPPQWWEAAISPAAAAAAAAAAARRHVAGGGGSLPPAARGRPLWGPAHRCERQTRLRPEPWRARRAEQQQRSAAHTSEGLSHSVA